jgi:hypothetical protein
MLKLLRCPMTPVDDILLSSPRPNRTGGGGGAAVRFSRKVSDTAARPLSSLSTMKLLDFFSSIQIYRRSKTVHFQAIREDLDVPYEEMVFFDDEPCNRNVQTELGVVMQLLDPSIGLSNDDVDKAVLTWRRLRYKRDGSMT